MPPDPRVTGYHVAPPPEGGYGSTWGGVKDFFFGKSADDIEIDPRATQLENGGKLRGQVQGYLDSVNGRQAPQAGQAATYGGANIYGGAQNQWRQQQMQLAQRLGAVASGQQQGAGELAAQRQAGNAIADQQAMARMSRGSGAALAARGAATNAANIGTTAQGIAKEAALQDQAAARGQLGQVLGQGRQGDLSTAINQAQLDQQAGLAGAGAQNQMSLANLQAKLSTMGMNDQATLGLMSQLTGLDLAELQARLEAEKLRQGIASSDNGIAGDILTAAGAIGAKAAIG